MAKTKTPQAIYQVEKKRAEKEYTSAISVATEACSPKCAELFLAWTFLHDLLRDEPGRSAEANAASEHAAAAMVEQPEK